MSHGPSRMFNITQLLSIASADLAEKCTHGVTLNPPTQELRGFPTYEGQYIDISKLDDMLERLGLVNATPIPESGQWSSVQDFSGNNWAENIVLAHPRIMGSAYVDRDRRRIQ